MDEKKNEKKPNENQRNQFNRKPRPNKKFGSSKESRGNKGFRDNRDFRGNREYDRNSQGPRNIRFGTKFCGECRACSFWIEPKIGKYRCESSYLPFEIVEIRRDNDSNITEIVIDLLV